MGESVIPEIRYVPLPDEPLARQARQVNDAAHGFKLSWKPEFEHYVATLPDTQEQVVGVVEFDESMKPPGERFGEIHITRLAVDADYRRRRIGLALVHHVVQLGIKAEYAAISAQPYTDASKALFRKYGFVASGRGKRLNYFRYFDLESRSYGLAERPGTSA